MTDVPSGWYPNPYNSNEEMYWDGASWTGVARRLSAARIEEATMVRTDGRATAVIEQAPPVAFEQAAFDSVVAEPAALEPAEFEPAAFDPTTLDPAAFDQAALDPATFDPAAFDPPVAQLLDVQWDAPTDARPQSEATARPLANWFATIALILGACGAAVTAVPLFIGLFAGGLLDVAAIAFGVLGVIRGRRLDGTGIVPALIGGVLGALGLVAMTIGAGTVW